MDNADEGQVVKIAGPELEIFDDKPKSKNLKSKDKDEKKVAKKLLKEAAKAKGEKVEEEEESEGEAEAAPEKEGPKRTNKVKETKPKWPKDYYFDYGSLDKLDPVSRYVNDEDI